MRRLVPTVLIALLAVPASAAASVDAIYEDCQDGRLDKRYPRSELREALDDMPADLDEYTNCRELIRAARDNQRGGGGAGPGSTHEDGDDYGALPAGEGGLPLGPDGKPIDPRGIAQPHERQELDRAREGIGRPPKVAGVSPGQHDADLPVPVIVLLVLTAGALLALVAPRLRDLVRSRLG
ncbi:MAG TPA: hypothetical protein VHF89_06015 [Solirubrobacteraceae bacterium]|nr:hypothetical protein [Solirubrobacteraceae bacterium]